MGVGRGHLCDIWKPVDETEGLEVLTGSYELVGEGVSCRWHSAPGDVKLMAGLDVTAEMRVYVFKDIPPSFRLHQYWILFDREDRSAWHILMPVVRSTQPRDYTRATAHRHDTPPQEVLDYYDIDWPGCED